MKTITEVNPQGYCGGVLRAIQIAKKTREENPDKTITILGNLVHNKYVKEALTSLHIDTIDDPSKTRLELLDEVNQGIVLFTAHGVSQQVKEKAKQKGLIGIDASCPFVVQTQKVVQEKLDKGYEILYIGKNKHPEAEAVYSTSAHVHLITKVEDIPFSLKEPIFVTNQTTMSILDIQTIFEKIKEMYPKAEFQNEICNATRVRQQAILDLKDSSIDCLIVVGDPSSNNTRKLADIGKMAKIPFVYPVESIEDFDFSKVKDQPSIAITSGASTPTYLRQQIIQYIQNPSQKPKIRIEEIL